MTADQVRLAGEVRIVNLRSKSEHQVVFAVLTRETNNVLKRILNLKARFPELSTNKYLFAVRGRKKTHIRGNKAFEWVADTLGFHITAKKLRKLAATNAVFKADLCKKKL